MEEKFYQFLEEYYYRIETLSAQSNLKYFDASISGLEEDYNEAAKLQLEMSRIYSDKELFKQLKEFKDSGEIKDVVKQRELQLIYNEFAGNQFSEELHKEIINLSIKIEKDFSTFRAEFNGNKISDNEIDKILDNSTNSAELKTVWEESKKIGKVVAEDVLKLVKLRNKGARDLGFENYHDMSLKLNEQDYASLDNLFNELNSLIEISFEQLKDEIDDYLSVKFGIPKDELMPWHYEDKFFQQGPKIYDTDIDKHFENKNISKITQDYFNGINLNIDDLIANSDLYEKDGKYQHAYCTDIDRNGDIRVLCNIKQNQRWMGTMLHEFGHAVYDKNISSKLPWQLRIYGHIFTTEAIAMLFGRLSHNPEWLKEMVGISEKDAAKIAELSFNSLRSEQLIFSRWVQVMYHFEKEMYSNPDQDLNAIWWQLVEKYQLIKKPEGRNEPDWAAKIHIALYPAYYHNYMLGELLASQLHNFITTKVLKLPKNNTESFVGKTEVGDYLKHLFFSYGALFPWNELIEKATGEELTPKYYAKQFVK
ncbi:MAG: M2 family metallopeptidase [Bacteroidetes bacterium]|nr:M2 family metallopeptidase [Bacteroidota bacterium]MBU1116987.1 M2 family metallopeptidase [Bacteroidota bacterium]MBU1797323.1 M2 family metallopeptidase [Bacteroidota bacterium]